MKRWASLIFGILLWAHSAAAQSGNIVQPERIYVRSGPSESYIAIGALFQGQEVVPTNRSADGTWILIEYVRITGWIQRDEVTWQIEPSQLPVLAADITPTARATQPLRLLSPTPAAAQGFVVVSGDVQTAIVRSGPSRGFSLLGQLTPGSLVEPVSRSQAGDWILIRFPDPITNLPGFGWIARDLVQWRDESVIEALPIISGDNLTPTATEDASIVIASPTPTTAPTEAVAAPPSNTPITPTSTLSPTVAATETTAPTVTLNLPTATDTLAPSATSIPLSETPVSATDITAVTVQAVSPFITNTPASDLSPTATDESRIIAPPATITPTLPTETSTPTLEPTPLPAEGPSQPEEPNGMLPLVAVAGLTVAGGLVYLGAFARAMPELRRYDQGFVRSDCLVCERGSLIVEEKRSSTLGIPAVRRTVRCSSCRSVLREKGPQRWTYAVDRLENPTLYERLNGREITDDELKAL